jgi:MIP family channel proteins
MTQQLQRTGLYGSSVGANMLAASVAELIGTFVLIYCGTAVATAALLQVPVAGPAYDSLATPLAFGLALVIVVASIGHVSGGHVNPAVTLGLAVTGRFPWRFVPAYIAAQMGGAVLGSLATWVSFGPAARESANLAATTPAPGVGVGQALLVEALVTFVLVFVVVSVATDERVGAGVAPIAVGFGLAVAVLISGPVSSAVLALPRRARPRRCDRGTGLRPVPRQGFCT